MRRKIFFDMSVELNELQKDLSVEQLRDRNDKLVKMLNKIKSVATAGGAYAPVPEERPFAASLLHSP